ncbi:aminoacyl-tRNA hydrolase [Agrobacterium rosae]|uniref:Peptidyl-tRNA hydrolase n=1 Tax=Agrobacterium rosae TaxID=1972867 RepID=A0AAE5S0X8_9HYPH|nr:aminoacyl-tRNA hydrolase [Agrobacterium rosae]KAA3513332.1 aminoacyl-tRNA hydrolase [Agrobacterium rosae]KAA3521186.1 aminoacyl-tRNA hydrolase [Agrobacterium rosae]MCM2432997.1 aminoacyl-tRNA hydrolase [Agrobacterium rosae]MDX8327934.1 aminoacyl-tRNA hydrolase [Agrobacterium rosae]MQB48045.1 aminoacyl-tRNA hydrolase [Agrobacterium rosae]
MIIIAGLGNPGTQYASNRHNIGFMAVDALQRLPSFSPWSKKFKAEISEGEIAEEKVLLMKPLTFMNLSGESVGEAMRFYKVKTSDIIAIHDELDLVAGRARIKIGGGHGGHNGLKSIDAHCGKDYRRLRLGIGHPGDKDRVNGHVLGDFAKSDKIWLEPLIDAIADNASMLVKGEDSQLMNKLALAVGVKSEIEKEAKPAKPTAKSHIHQARNSAQPKKLPETGPMADMLKRMFGKKD